MDSSHFLHGSLLNEQKKRTLVEGLMSMEEISESRTQYEADVVDFTDNNVYFKAVSRYDSRYTTSYKDTTIQDLNSDYYYVTQRGVLKKRTSEYVPTDSEPLFQLDLSGKTDYQVVESTFDTDDTLFNFIMGTPEVSGKNLANAGDYIFSNSLFYGSETAPTLPISGICQVLKEPVSDYDSLFNGELTSRVRDPKECTQKAIDNTSRFYALQLNQFDNNYQCTLLNENEPTAFQDGDSTQICDNNIGIDTNATFGIFDTSNVGDSSKFYTGGYVNFDSNFVAAESRDDFVHSTGIGLQLSIEDLIPMLWKTVQKMSVKLDTDI